MSVGGTREARLPRPGSPRGLPFVTAATFKKAQGRGIRFSRETPDIYITPIEGRAFFALRSVRRGPNSLDYGTSMKTVPSFLDTPFIVESIRKGKQRTRLTPRVFFPPTKAGPQSVCRSPFLVRPS